MRSAITPSLLVGDSPRGRRRGGERRHRLSRHRVPALGPGPERYRAPVPGHAPRNRFRPRELHRGQLRPARPEYLKAASTLLIADLEEMVAQLGSRRRRPVGPPRRAGRRARRNPHRDGIAVVWRACGRAHEARASSPRSGRGARLLLRQHPQLPLLRSDRDPQRLRRALPEGRRLRRSPDPPWPTSWPQPSLPLDEELRAGAGRRRSGRWPRMRSRAESVEAYDQMLGEGNTTRKRGGPGRGRCPGGSDPIHRASGCRARSRIDRNRRDPTASTTRTRCSSKSRTAGKGQWVGAEKGCRFSAAHCPSRNG